MSVELLHISSSSQLSVLIVALCQYRAGNLIHRGSKLLGIHPLTHVGSLIQFTNDHLEKTPGNTKKYSSRCLVWFDNSLI